MDYQEIISSYEKKGLDITDLKEKLEIAKPLKGREKFRALDMIAQRSALINDTSNVLIISEIYEKLDVFFEDMDAVLEEYFNILVQSIKSAKAWKFMRLVPLEYTTEKFQNLSREARFQMLYGLNKRYLSYLEYQNVADIRDCLRNGKRLNDETIMKLKFLTSMFDSFKNKEIKNEFFCFDKNFLLALVDFRKSNCLRLEDYMKTKSKSVEHEYEKFLNFFTNEDFRNISENLVLTSKTLKNSVRDVIEAFSELSESESEVGYLIDEYEELKKLEKKYLKMKILNIEYTKKKAKLEKILQVKKASEEKKKQALAQLLKKQNAENKAKKAKELKTQELKAKLEFINPEENKKKIVKEQVNPLIFSWLEKEDLTLTRRVGNKTIVEFLNKIKEIQERNGIRVSLYIVTNAGREVALKRLFDFQKKANTNGLPDLVEGVLGGYSTFRIDSEGNITNLATMSEINRNKIINLLERTKGSILTSDKLEPGNDSYLRYQLTDRKDKSVTKEYLNLIVKNLLGNEVIKRQPIKFLPYMEGRYIGIDVLLDSQLKGISQLPEYYKQKYNIAPGKTMNARIDDLESFINNQK